jgi:RecB family exonuclease
MRASNPTNAIEFERYLASQVDIAVEVGKHVPLAKRGDHLVGRCPFHPEGVNKDLAINPRSQRFLCWSPGCSYGDVFDFLAKWHSVTREEAVRILGDGLGIRAHLLDSASTGARDTEFHTSFSALKLFVQCPLRYRYRYIDRKHDQKGTHYLALGRVVHKTMADFFRLDPGSRSLNNLLGTLDRNLKSARSSENEERRETRIRAEAMLTSYYHSHDCAVETWGVETPIRYSFEGSCIHGAVDRIDRLPDGGHELVEYKTEPLESGEENINRVQLAFYYFGVRESYDLQVSKLTLEYLPSQSAISLPTSKAELEEQLLVARGIVHEIHSTRDFRPRRNKYCMDCLLAPTCAQRGQSGLGTGA